MLTYEELLAECELHGFSLATKNKVIEHKFTAIARFERGLGAEYVNLKPVEAKTISEAQTLANTQSALYFKATVGLEDAVVKEVRIMPVGKIKDK